MVSKAGTGRISSQPSKPRHIYEPTLLQCMGQRTRTNLATRRSIVLKVQQGLLSPRRCRQTVRIPICSKTHLPAETLFGTQARTSASILNGLISCPATGPHSPRGTTPLASCRSSTVTGGFDQTFPDLLKNDMTCKRARTDEIPTRHMLT